MNYIVFIQLPVWFAEQCIDVVFEFVTGWICEYSPIKLSENLWSLFW